MKKLLKWMKIQLRKIFKKTVSKMELLEASLYEMKEKRTKTTEALYNYKGKVKYFQDTIKEIENKIVELMKAAKIVAENGNDVLLARCKSEIDILEDKKIRLEKNLELSKKLSDRAYIQKNLADSKVSEIESKMDALKMKSDFKNEVDEFSTIIDGDLGIDIEDIEKDINVEFNASELKLDDIEADNFDINDIIKKEDLEDFKNKLKG